ncbi:hypothetical protein [Kiloniella antarctica]|uniref:hypothetical protein n=1 Tax=Kiloniella antarctica TaxID=1550907 RepID=UPI0036D34C21
MSAPLMGAGANDHGGKMNHHGVMVDNLGHSDVVVDQDNSAIGSSGAEGLRDDCLQIFHCSSPNTLVSFFSEQKRVSFYQHNLWSLHKSEVFRSQTPTVDLRPPRSL